MVVKELLRDKIFLKILLIILAVLSVYCFAPYWIKADIASLKTEDLFTSLIYSFRGPSERLDDMVIVSIDEESMVALGQRWPWPRDLFALAIDKLKDCSPASISIDLAFIGESVDKEADEAIVNAFDESGNIIIASHFDKEGRYILPSKTIRESVYAFGFINKPRDADLVVRRTRPLMMSTAGNVIDHSFALKTAVAYLGITMEDMSYDTSSRTFTFRSGEGARHDIALDNEEAFRITYSAKEELFNIVPFWKIISGELDPSLFKKKMVLFGITAELFHDIYETPLGLMPGVLLNANEILMYVEKTFIRKLPGWFIIFLQFLIAMIIFFITYKSGLGKGFFMLSVVVISVLIIKVVFSLRNVYFDFFGIAFSGTFSYFMTYGYKSIDLLIDNAILRREATIDTLTGLYVYRFFEVKLRSEFRRAKEAKGEDLSLIICDIDNFKSINDTYGHECGNVVLRDLAKVLSKFSRRGDAICRYGGEEFCFILPHTAKWGALEYAQRVLESVELHKFETAKGTLSITASFGVASMHDGARTPETLTKMADTALYEAKKTGKNKVSAYNNKDL